MIAMSADATKTYRRAEFWEDDTCTLLDIANVIGRWESADAWSQRTEFALVENARVENMAQGATKERHEWAQRNGYVERVALQQNCQKLPFTNARLASAFGKSVEELDALPVSKVAVDVVFDALCESKSSLLPAEVCDKRRARWLAADGGIDETALALGLFKSRLLVSISWIFFGKGQIYGAVVSGKVALDTTGFWEKLPPEIKPYAEPIFWLLALVAAVYAYQVSAAVVNTTSDYETVSREEATEYEENNVGYDGVLEKWARSIEAWRSKSG